MVCLQLDTSNEAVVTQHVMCAAAELALTPVQGGLDSQLFGPQLPRAVAALKAQGLLGTHPRLVTAPDPQGGSDPTTAAHHPLFYTGSAAGGAARSVTLRCIDPEQFVILDESSRKVLEQVEGRKAFYQVYGEKPSAFLGCEGCGTITAHSIIPAPYLSLSLDPPSTLRPP